LATCPASGVDDAVAVAVDQRQHRRLVLLEVAERPGLVLAHEAAVAGDVRRQDGGELHRGHAVVVHALFSMRRQAALGQHEECCECWRSWAATGFDAPGLAGVHSVQEGAVEPYRAQHVGQGIGAHGVAARLSPDAPLTTADARLFTRHRTVRSVTSDEKDMDRPMAIQEEMPCYWENCVLS
jgi:hypothetical protein